MLSRVIYSLKPLPYRDCLLVLTSAKPASLFLSVYSKHAEHLGGLNFFISQPRQSYPNVSCVYPKGDLLPPVSIFSSLSCSPRQGMPRAVQNMAVPPISLLRTHNQPGNTICLCESQHSDGCLHCFLLGKPLALHPGWSSIQTATWVGGRNSAVFALYCIRIPRSVMTAPV